MQPHDRYGVALLVVGGLCLAVVGALGYGVWHFFIR